MAALNNTGNKIRNEIFLFSNVNEKFLVKIKSRYYTREFTEKYFA
jgi:hypothetical protein